MKTYRFSHPALSAMAVLALSTASAAIAGPQPLRTNAHNDPNVVSKQSPKRVAIVLSNPATSGSTKGSVGFWWAELTHPYFAFAEKGYEIEIFSYSGGRVEADPLSNPDDPSHWQGEDLISRGFMGDKALMALLSDTKPAKSIDVSKFDAIVVAGGQGPMWTLQGATDLQKKFVEFYEKGKIAAALCHGTAVLRFARLSNGEPLVKGKTVTGFANVEEDFADAGAWQYKLLPRGAHVMPWRIEDELKKLGANYLQAGMWKSFAIRDGNLITGQQNYSGAATAELVIKALGE